MEKELGAAETESLVEEEVHIDSSELHDWKNSCNQLLSFLHNPFKPAELQLKFFCEENRARRHFSIRDYLGHWTSGRESSGREGWDWDRRSRRFLIFYLYLSPLSIFALLSLTKGGREGLDDCERESGWLDWESRRMGGSTRCLHHLHQTTPRLKTSAAQERQNL